jgi:AcrR family transcriptional regulator
VIAATCFVHIPKTGGSWVTQGLQSAVPEEHRYEVPSADVGRVPLRRLLQQYAFVSGHFTMAEVSHVLHETFVFTFLREPVDRVVSLYHFYRQQPGGAALDPRVEQVQAHDFHSFVESLTSRISPWSNWQTYVLSGCAHCEVPARDLLPCALANLQQLDFVGVQEHLASGLAALGHLRQWTITPPSEPVNVTRSRPKRDALPASVRRKLQDLNDCDAELYEAALRRWQTLQGRRNGPRRSVSVATHWSDRREMGTREIEITSATIDEVRGTIRVHLTSHIAEPNLTVGIRIANDEGVEVYGTNTRLERRPLQANPGDRLVAQFEFPSVLQPGAHFLTVAAHRGADHLERCFHWIDNVAQFHAPSYTRTHMRGTAMRTDIREAILDAVDRRLARFGYKKMTVEGLAEEAGIGKGTVYLHFPSKEDAVLSHVDRIVERLCGRLDTIAGGGGPVDLRLHSMLVERVTYRLSAVQHYTQSLDDLLSAIRPLLLERRVRHFAREAERFERLLNEGRRAEVFEPVRVPTTARALIEATNALLPYSLSPQELGDLAGVRRRAVAIADLLVGGLRGARRRN